MDKPAHFKVDPKLAQLLGETYRSIEQATKELIDNSYDADAENVLITMPTELLPLPIITIEDDGSGMKENEVRNEYLNIANSRTSRKGNLSIQKKRKIKGRKGIGKFAGLMVADQMKIETWAAGTITSLTINRHDLSKAGYDLEKVPLPIKIEDCEIEKHGTRITLDGLNQNFNYPNPERLKELLVRDFGRDTDFNLRINDENIGVSDLAGTKYACEIELPNLKKAQLVYTITEKPVKHAGIAIRVNNKIVGKPQNFFEDDEIIPPKLLNRVYGEIICDDLEEDITADFGAIVENSKLFDVISEKSTEHIKIALDEIFETDMKMARARYQQKINKELEKLPEFKQPYAKKALYRVLEKFYGESEERINTVISVMVSAMERDHYWELIQNIEETGSNDIEKFAEALSEFGMVEMSIITNQAISRLRFLDQLNILIDDSKTLERTIHKAIENNTWILGDEYSVLFSDLSLRSAVSTILNKKYKGKAPDDRPDLLLGKRSDKQLVLIELKRPNFTLNRKTELQAIEYRDELDAYFHNQPIMILLLGGKVNHSINSSNDRNNVQYRSYLDVVSSARQRLEWLIEELKKDKPIAVDLPERAILGESF